jgi:hypothetical protein
MGVTELPEELLPLAIDFDALVAVPSVPHLEDPLLRNRIELAVADLVRRNELLQPREEPRRERQRLVELMELAQESQER